jgi:hypothetical protein
MKGIFLIGVAALFLATGVAHADITGGRYGEGSVMYIDIIGDIKPGDDNKVKRLINTRDMVIVRLASGGGDLVTGINIGELVHAHGEETFTIAVKDCASVCGLIWLAGHSRSAEADAKVGFHAAYYAADGRVTAEGNAMVGAYLNRLRLSYAAIRYLTSTPPDSIRWLDCKALDDYGIEAWVNPPKGSDKIDVCMTGDKMWGRR